jgi:transcriptional regulator GlxA family with amidase domain
MTQSASRETFRSTEVSRFDRPRQHGTDVRVELAQRFVLRNLARKIHLEDAARAARLERHYFATVFRRVTGRTFVTWLREQRVGHAMQLLAKNRRSIGAVAREVGYRDWTGLERAFNSVLGMSPSMVRKLIRDGKLKALARGACVTGPHEDTRPTDMSS